MSHVVNNDVIDQQREQAREHDLARRNILTDLEDARLQAAREYFFQAQSLITAYHKLLAADRAPTLLQPTMQPRLSTYFTTTLQLPALDPTVAPDFLLPTRDTVLAHGRLYIVGGQPDPEASQKQADKIAHQTIHDLRRARQDAGLAWPFPT